MRPNPQVEAATAKVEAALTSREEAANLRRRLLEMIVENEKKRHSPPTTYQCLTPLSVKIHQDA